MYKAILLTLNKTLVPNYQAANAKMADMADTENWMRNREEYNSWVIEWLNNVDSRVYIFTSRCAKYREATLEGVSMRSSLKLDGAYFNDTGYKSSDVARVKRALLKRFLDDTGLQAKEIYIFESNQKAMNMWEKRGVPGKIVTKCSDLPPDVGPFKAGG